MLNILKFSLCLILPHQHRMHLIHFKRCQVQVWFNSEKPPQMVFYFLEAKFNPLFSSSWSLVKVSVEASGPLAISLWFSCIMYPTSNSLLNHSNLKTTLETHFFKCSDKNIFSLWYSSFQNIPDPIASKRCL